MQINTNIMAMNANRNLTGTNESLSGSLERLSSGFRINRAADDAAGLSRSEGLRVEVNGTQQAVRNAQDGVSFVQTAEGALEEVHGMLQRMRELATSAATGTSDGSAEQDEIEELAEEINAIGDRTTFSGDAVFADYDGGDDLTFHVGPGSGDQITISQDLRIDNAGANGFIGEDLTGLTVDGDTTDATDAMDDLSAAIENVSGVRSELGASQNRLESSINNLRVADENLSAAESRIRDADMATEMVDFTRNQIMQQAGTSMLAQANTVPQSVLGLLQ